MPVLITPVIGICLVSSYNHSSNTCCLDSGFLFYSSTTGGMCWRWHWSTPLSSTSFYIRYSQITVLSSSRLKLRTACLNKTTLTNTRAVNMSCTWGHFSPVRTRTPSTQPQGRIVCSWVHYGAKRKMTELHYSSYIMQIIHLVLQVSLTWGRPVLRVSQGLLMTRCRQTTSVCAGFWMSLPTRRGSVLLLSVLLEACLNVSILLKQYEWKIYFVLLHT